MLELARVAAKVTFSLFVFGGWLMLMLWVKALSDQWAQDIGLWRPRKSHRVRRWTACALRVAVALLAVAGIYVIWSF